MEIDKHFTSTVYLIHEEKILLHPHPKHAKWLPPGGHIEKNETPPQAAKREVKEETGLTIQFFSQENLWIDAPNAKSIERPYMCLLENIEKPYPHQHIDFIFLAEPVGKILPDNNQFQWLTLDQALQLQDIFEDTKLTIFNIFNQVLLK